eukprot:6483214-Amphidinium_carterae.2
MLHARRRPLASNVRSIPAGRGWRVISWRKVPFDNYLDQAMELGAIVEHGQSEGEQGKLIVVASLGELQIRSLGEQLARFVEKNCAEALLVDTPPGSSACALVEVLAAKLGKEKQWSWSQDGRLCTEFGDGTASRKVWMLFCKADLSTFRLDGQWLDSVDLQDPTVPPATTFLINSKKVPKHAWLDSREWKLHLDPRSAAGRGVRLPKLHAKVEHRGSGMMRLVHHARGPLPTLSVHRAVGDEPLIFLLQGEQIGVRKLLPVEIARVHGMPYEKWPQEPDWDTEEAWSLAKQQAKALPPKSARITLRTVFALWDSQETRAGGAPDLEEDEQKSEMLQWASQR